jgi:hypothetical protein
VKTKLVLLVALVFLLGYGLAQRQAQPPLTDDALLRKMATLNPPGRPRLVAPMPAPVPTSALSSAPSSPDSRTIPSLGCRVDVLRKISCDAVTASGRTVPLR